MFPLFVKVEKTLKSKTGLFLLSTRTRTHARDSLQSQRTFHFIWTTDQPSMVMEAVEAS